MNIPITKTVFGEDEKKTIIQPLESGWVVQGPFVSKFQELFSTFVNTKYAYATSNCTTALHAGLEALGIGEGDKVIVPSFTYIASANAIEYTGAKPIFCDIDLKTFNIDITHMEDLIKNDPSIRAIMPVNLFGLCANMLHIMHVAKHYGLKVIEDSACGFDSWINEQHSGTFGDCGCFSFHPRKAISTGEGGMLVTNDTDIARSVEQLRDHGASKSDLQRHIQEGGSLLPEFNIRGYNYRMTDIQGALGVCQMNKQEYIMKGRRKVAAWYDDALKEVPALMVPYIPHGFRHGYQSYVCLFTNNENITQLTKKQIDRLNISRNHLMSKLEKRGIATRQGTHAIHTLGYYKNKYQLHDEDFLMSYAADRLSIALPLYTEMSENEFEYVIDALKREI